jgi:class 3 adenylate cyclase/predicted ATPase
MADYSADIYIPMDRRQALAAGETLPENSHGTALFADISGFTPLTEALTRSLGARQGAEELTRQLNRVYDALIAEVDRYHGSVIGFSGDAITCWFDGGPWLAVGCAQAMQQAMQAFNAVAIPNSPSVVALAVKTALATGPVRRWLVGDPQVHLLDALAGATLMRMSHAEHAAERGEIVIDTVTAEQLADHIQLIEWRTLEESGEQFAVIAGVDRPIAPQPWPILPAGALSDAQIRPWLLPPVYERLHDGLGEFLTELRPSVALFLRFSGIDYDRDPQADEKLNAYIYWVQSILARYGGSMIDLTIGDKGSYLYASFGAPLAYENDPQRAISAALDLCTIPATLGFIEPVQMGISRGTMRTGACGGRTRRTYAVLGDEVNLAARLMQNAAPGTVLVNQSVRLATRSIFEWSDLPALRVKGKSEPVAVARPLRELPDDAQADESRYATPLVGRDSELAALETFLQPIFSDAGNDDTAHFAGLCYLYGEAGMGKSRLIYEARQHVSQKQNRPDLNWFVCPAEQVLRQSLYPFKRFLQRYFADDFEYKFETLLTNLQSRASAEPLAGVLVETLARRRSFLGALIDQYWENSPYELADPKLRYENTASALRALILAESLCGPTVLNMEDAQWLDADSQQLLGTLLQEAATYPRYALAVLLVSRYRDDGLPFILTTAPPIPATIPTYSIDLNQLSASAIRAVAEAVFKPRHTQPISDALATFFREKTDGNPFFIEQLALDLQERGVLHVENGQLSAPQKALAELPAGINSLLVARLDRLVAHVKAIVQIASVVGVEFDLRVLAYIAADDLDLFAKVQSAEAEAIWSVRNEAAYLFRHALLRDAAYDMQIEERLRGWHSLTANAIEQIYADDLAAHAANLAYHFGRAGDHDQEYTYSRMAGDFAAARYANADALLYFNRALELTTTDAERYTIRFKREHLYDLQGDRGDQGHELTELEGLAEALADDGRRCEVALLRAPYAEFTGDYPAAASAARQAIQLAERIGDLESQAAGHYQLGRALSRQDDSAAALAESIQALALAQQVHIPLIEAKTLLVLGNLALNQGRPAEARAYFMDVLTIRQQIKDRQGEGLAHNNLGGVAWSQGDFVEATTRYSESLRLSIEVGDRRSQGIALANLGNLALSQGRYVAAGDYTRQALIINRATGDRRSEAISLNNLSEIALRLGDYGEAQITIDAARTLSEAIGDHTNVLYALIYQSWLDHGQGDDQAAYEHGQAVLALARDQKARSEEAHALSLMGRAALGLAQFAKAAELYNQALLIQRALGQSDWVMDSLAGLLDCALRQGTPITNAVQLVPMLDELLTYLEDNTLHENDDPMLVYLIVYQVLYTAVDDRASVWLDKANQVLQQQAALLGEAAPRFMTAVKSHQVITAAVQNQS